MSYREKSAWICLVTTVAIFTPYFIYVFRLMDTSAAPTSAIAAALITAIASQAALNIAVHVGLAIRRRCERKDERDAAIEARSTVNAYYLLSALVFIGVLPLMLWGRAHSVVFYSQLLLGCFVAAETLKYLGQAVRYRTGV